MSSLPSRSQTIRLDQLKAVVFDWAGTTIDYGSLAPVTVMISLFRELGIDVTEAEAREPMGIAKIDHIVALLNMPRIANQWASMHGALRKPEDVQRIYTRFLSLQKEVLSRHSMPISGVSVAVERLRAVGMAIGSTTGYTRELMEVVMPIAAENGFQPDVCVCSDEVRAGRPAPWQLFRTAELLDVYPMSSIIVVDDTVAGIEAGLHAGCWTVGVSRTGNGVGLTEAQWAMLQEEDRKVALDRATNQLREAGADWVIESVAELPDLLTTF
jgi:phosphonoacetaldehyde hydrolase